MLVIDMIGSMPTLSVAIIQEDGAIRDIPPKIFKAPSTNMV